MVYKPPGQGSHRLGGIFDQLQTQPFGQQNLAPPPSGAMMLPGYNDPSRLRGYTGGGETMEYRVGIDGPAPMETTEDWQKRIKAMEAQRGPKPEAAPSMDPGFAPPWTQGGGRVNPAQPGGGDSRLFVNASSPGQRPLPNIPQITPQQYDTGMQGKSLYRNPMDGWNEATTVPTAQHPYNLQPTPPPWWSIENQSMPTVPGPTVAPPVNTAPSFNAAGQLAPPPRATISTTGDATMGMRYQPPAAPPPHVATLDEMSRPGWWRDPPVNVPRTSAEADAAFKNAKTPEEVKRAIDDLGRTIGREVNTSVANNPSNPIGLRRSTTFMDAGLESPAEIKVKAGVAADNAIAGGQARLDRGSSGSAGIVSHPWQPDLGQGRLPAAPSQTKAQIAAESEDKAFETGQRISGAARDREMSGKPSLMIGPGTVPPDGYYMGPNIHQYAKGARDNYDVAARGDLPNVTPTWNGGAMRDLWGMENKNPITGQPLSTGEAARMIAAKKDQMVADRANGKANPGDSAAAPLPWSGDNLARFEKHMAYNPARAGLESPEVRRALVTAKARGEPTTTEQARFEASPAGQLPWGRYAAASNYNPQSNSFAPEVMAGNAATAAAGAGGRFDQSIEGEIAQNAIRNNQDPKEAIRKFREGGSASGKPTAGGAEPGKPAKYKVYGMVDNRGVPYSSIASATDGYGSEVDDSNLKPTGKTTPEGYEIVEDPNHRKYYKYFFNNEWVVVPYRGSPSKPSGGPSSKPSGKDNSLPDPGIFATG